jgi:hypothetical protein
MGWASVGILAIVDVVLSAHSVFSFLLQLLCTARVYIRHQIRDHPLAPNLHHKYPCENFANCSRIEHHSPREETADCQCWVSQSTGRSNLYSMAHKFLLYYTHFGIIALFAFSKAFYVFIQFLMQQIAATCIMHWRMLSEYLFSHLNSEWADVGTVNKRCLQLVDWLPSDKKLPNHVVIIVPLTSLRPMKVTCSVLNGVALFFKLLNISNVTIYFPFITETGTKEEIKGYLASFVECLFSIAESQQVMLDAMNVVRNEGVTVTKETLSGRMSSPHADMILVLGGSPCLYGFTPWNTKLSEIFFLPHIQHVNLNDVVGATSRFLSIEQRFGK